MRDAGLDVGVIYPEMRSLRSITPTKIVENHFQVSSGLGMSQLPEVRWHGQCTHAGSNPKRGRAGRQASETGAP